MAYRYSPNTRWFAWLALMLPVVMIAACTTEPMTAVSDFEYQFEDDFPTDLPTEVDTSTVEIEYEEVEEDTAYVETQQNFAAEADQAAQNNQTPQAMVEAGEAADAAVDEETEAGLNEIGEQAEEDPEGAADDLEEALDDPDSPQSQLANTVEDAAAQQATLAALLGLNTTASGKVSMREPGDALPVPQTETLFDVSDALGTLTCRGDAEAAFERALNQITTNRDQALATAQQTYQNSVTKVENFRSQQLAFAQSRRAFRRSQAVDFFTLVRNAINAAQDAGLVTENQVRQMRLMNRMVFVVSINRARRTFRQRVNGANAAADAALQAAVTKRDSQVASINQTFEQRRNTAQQTLQRLLDQCHDQGQTTG